MAGVRCGGKLAEDTRTANCGSTTSCLAIVSHASSRLGGEEKKRRCGHGHPVVEFPGSHADTHKPLRMPRKLVVWVVKRMFHFVVGRGGGGGVNPVRYTICTLSYPMNSKTHLSNSQGPPLSCPHQSTNSHVYSTQNKKQQRDKKQEHSMTTEELYVSMSMSINARTHILRHAQTDQFCVAQKTTLFPLPLRNRFLATFHCSCLAETQRCRVDWSNPKTNRTIQSRMELSRSLPRLRRAVLCGLLLIAFNLCE